MPAPRSGAARSAHPIPAAAVGEVAGRLLETVGPAPDLCLVTVPTAMAGALDDIAAALTAILAPGVLLGGVVTAGSAASVVPEDPSDALLVWAANLGPVAPFALHVDPTTGEVRGIPGLRPDDAAVLVLAPDLPTATMLTSLEALSPARTGVPVVGAALADVTSRGAWNRRLVLGSGAVDAAAVGVVLGPTVEVEVLCAGGTLPVGPAMTATTVDGHMLLELDGSPARAVLDRVAAGASPEERSALRRGVHLGFLADTVPGLPGAAEERVLDVLGMDRARSALALPEPLEAGCTVRFHVPDPDEAERSLALALADAADGRPVAGVLLLTGPGRPATTEGLVRTDTSAVDGSLGVESGGIHGARPIVPGWGRSHLLGSAGAALLVLRPAPTRRPQSKT